MTDLPMNTPEIEVTPEMIEAGVAALSGYQEVTVPPELWAARIYRAMERARQTHTFTSDDIGPNDVIQFDYEMGADDTPRCVARRLIKRAVA